MANLTEIHAKRIQLRDLEKQLQNPDLGLFEKCELQDQILEIKEALGEFERSHNERGECENCSG
jgi:hypothetical protein